MNDTLKILLHADPSVLTALLGVVVACGGVIAAVGYVVKQIGAARAKAIVASADADAKAKINASKADLADAETTGKFLTLAAKDREQIDSLVADVRAELKQCERERVESRFEIAGLRASNAKLEEKNAQLEGRVAELERSRGALFEELQQVRRSVDSGGAYPMPNKEG